MAIIYIQKIADIQSFSTSSALHLLQQISAIFSSLWSNNFEIVGAKYLPLSFLRFQVCGGKRRTS